MEQVDEKRPPTLRERLKEAATGEILDAAEAIMIRKGFDGATMQDIAAAVGCAAGTLYLHFKSKEAIFFAITARRAETLFGSAHAAMASATDPLDKIYRGILAHFRYLEANKEFFRLFFSINPFRPKGMQKNAGPEAWAMRNTYEEAELKCLLEAQDKGLIRHDIPADIIQASLDAMAINLADEFVQEGTTLSSEELMRIVWGLFLHGASEGGRHAKK